MHIIDSNSKSSLKRWVYDLIILFIIPIGLILLNPNIIFLNSAPGTVDAWGYLGYFLNISEHVRQSVGGYPASRLGLTLFGAFFYSLFSPIIAHIMIRFVLYYITSVSVYWIVRNLYKDHRLALISTIILLCHPTMWIGYGADYIDGAVILYIVLFLGLITLSNITNKLANFFAFIAGNVMALLMSTHLFTLILLPNLLLWLVYNCYAQAKSKRKRLIQTISQSILGFCVGILALAVISWILGGHFLYLSSSLNFAKIFSNSTTNPWAYQCYLKLDDYWISATIVPMILSVYSVFKSVISLHQSKKLRSKSRLLELARENFNQVNFLLAFSLFLIIDLIEGCPLKFYFSMLVPFCFLAVIEFINNRKLLNQIRYDQIIACLCLAQAIFLLVFTRFLMSGLDEASIIERLKYLQIILLSVNLVLSILILAINKVNAQFLFGQLKKRNIITILWMILLTSVPSFKGEGFYSNQIYSNFEQYQSFFQVTKYLEQHHSLVNSLYWYNANSVIGDHFRSIASSTFLSGNLIGEQYPYYSSIDDSLANNKGQLNTQISIDPGSRIIVLTDEHSNAAKEIIDAFSIQGLHFQVLGQKMFHLGRYKFSVFIGEAQQIQPQSQNRIYKCRLTSKAKYAKRNDSSLIPDAPNCFTEFSASQDTLYIISQAIPIERNSNYLISTDAYAKAGSYTVHLHKSDKNLPDRNEYNSFYNKIFFDKKNSNQPLLRKTVCENNTQGNHQFIFRSQDNFSIKFVLYNSSACDYSSLEAASKNFDVSEISIYKLPREIAFSVPMPPRINQNMIRNWWRVRYPDLLVQDVSFDETTQLFKLITNKSYEDFQLVSSEFSVTKGTAYTVIFKYKISLGGFSLISLANDGKTILSKSSFCSRRPHTEISSGKLKFNSRQFESAKIVIANYSNCLAGNGNESKFYIGDIQFRNIPS